MVKDGLFQVAFNGAFGNFWSALMKIPQVEILRIKDDGTSRNIVWGAIFEPIGVTLPTTTTASKLLYIGCIYNADSGKWDVIAVTEEA